MSEAPSTTGSAIDQRYQENKEILNELITIVRKCQTKYGGIKELATEKDDLVVKLCDILEKAFSYGLKTPHVSVLKNKAFSYVLKTPHVSVLKNVQEIVSRSSVEQYTFWDFSQPHITRHEKERFTSLHNVWTNRGRTKAFFRAALNERSLERYILMWLGDPSLCDVFERWALLRDPEAANLLPSMAAGLSSILFAIAVDTPDINILQSEGKRQEPIIFAPHPIGPSKKSVAVNRAIVSFDTEAIEVENSVENKSVPEIKGEFVENPVTVPNENIYLEIKAATTDGYRNHTTIDLEENPKSNESSKNFEYDNTANVEYLFNNSESNLFDLSKSSSENSVIIENSSMSSAQSHRTSARSSVSSISQQTDMHRLENNLKELTERCTFLEAKVSDLSLENRRLHRLLNHTNRDTNFLINIPKVVPMGSGPRKYYAYQIHISSKNGLDNWVILRRYREFYKLHQKLKAVNTTIKALDCPPKKKIGNLDILFVADRRQRLQIYLRNVLTLLPEISSCNTKSQLQAVFPFLQ